MNKMVLVFCTECGYRFYTRSKAISQEFCECCGKQGTLEKVAMKDGGDHLSEEMKQC
jgi:uncharacterized OB-fold protein